MIDLAQKKYPHENFKTADFSSSAFQENFDYLVACGVLNLLNGDSAAEHLEYIKKFIKKMFGLANKGAALNLLSIKGKHLFEEDPLFYYAEPGEILAFCRSFCPAATIEKDYLPHDFTLYLPKN